MTGGDPRLRVLFLAERTALDAGVVPPHGSGAHVAATLAGLRDHFEVLPVLAEAAPAVGVMASPGAPSTARRLVPARVRGARRDLGLLRADRRFRERAAAAAAAFRPDVVYERSEYMASAGSRLARELGVPLVLEVNGLPDMDMRPQYRSLAEPYGDRLERLRQRAAAVIVVESPGMADALERRGVPRVKLAVVPNSVPERKIAPWPRARGDGEPVIGWIGHLMPWYLDSIRFLVDAAPAVIGEVPGARFEVVAGGPGLQDLERYAARRGVGGSFRFRDPVPYDEVPEVLAGFDIGVIPSAFAHQFPVKLVEMGAAGLALVAPATVSIDGLLAGGVEYEPFAPGDRAGLAAALVTVARSPERRASLGEAVRAAVAERFTWTAAGEGLARAVRSAQAG